MERNLTRERTKAAIAAKHANGKRIGTVPNGYALADDGAMLLMNEQEQPIVNEIQRMATSDGSSNTVQNN